LKWSQARRRYERQGLLVEDEALARAETECLEDEEARARRREREAVRRAEEDADFVSRFAERLGELYPASPPERRGAIAAHACRKYSGRVGRSAAGKGLDERAVELAVVAHVRHTETEYDTLLGRGWERRQARRRVGAEVDRVLARWRGSGP
jgi:hypothetical protein